MSTKTIYGFDDLGNKVPIGSYEKITGYTGHILLQGKNGGSANPSSIIVTSNNKTFTYTSNGSDIQFGNSQS